MALQNHAAEPSQPEEFKRQSVVAMLQDTKFWARSLHLMGTEIPVRGRGMKTKSWVFSLSTGRMAAGRKHREEDFIPGENQEFGLGWYLLENECSWRRDGAKGPQTHRHGGWKEAAAGSSPETWHKVLEAEERLFQEQVVPKGAERTHPCNCAERTHSATAQREPTWQQVQRGSTLAAIGDNVGDLGVNLSGVEGVTTRF